MFFKVWRVLKILETLLPQNLSFESDAPVLSQFNRLIYILFPNLYILDKGLVNPIFSDCIQACNDTLLGLMEDFYIWDNRCKSHITLDYINSKLGSFGNVSYIFSSLETWIVLIRLAKAIHVSNSGKHFFRISLLIDIHMYESPSLWPKMKIFSSTVNNTYSCYMRFVQTWVISTRQVN